MKLNKLATTVLALSMTHAANATDNSDQSSPDQPATFWGFGIGTIVGGIIAGPPGALVGASLGGAIGWGQDKDIVLDESLAQLEGQQLAIEQSQEKLRENRNNLKQTRQKLIEVRRVNALQSARLSDYSAQEDNAGELKKNPVLEDLIQHYAQEIYFRHGESEVPEYARARLSSLTEFLKTQPHLTVTLKGYTDHLGAADYNVTLAQARVDGIRRLLMNEGVAEKRVSAHAIGEVESQSQPGDAGNYILDRRVSVALSFIDQVEQPVASIGEVIQ